MSVVDVVRQSISAFVAVVKSAGDLTQAPRIQITALKTQGAELLDLMDSSSNSLDSVLDAANPSLPVTQLPDYLTTLQQTAADSLTLSDMRGLVGRAIFNINQV